MWKYKVHGSFRDSARKLSTTSKLWTFFSGVGGGGAFPTKKQHCFIVETLVVVFSGFAAGSKGGLKKIADYLQN